MNRNSCGAWLNFYSNFMMCMCVYARLTITILLTSFHSHVSAKSQFVFFSFLFLFIRFLLSHSHYMSFYLFIFFIFIFFYLSIVHYILLLLSTSIHCNYIRNQILPFYRKAYGIFLLFQTRSSFCARYKHLAYDAQMELLTMKCII